MKAQYRALGGKLILDIEGEGIKGIYKAVSEIDEIFGSVMTCGACGGAAVQLRVREVADNNYFEAQCQTQGCRARLEFGQTKLGHSIFPKRKSKDGDWLPNRGWTIYKAAHATASDADESQPF